MRSDLTKMTLYRLHTIQWKHLRVAVVLCPNLSNIALFGMKEPKTVTSMQRPTAILQILFCSFCEPSTVACLHTEYFTPSASAPALVLFLTRVVLKPTSSRANRDGGSGAPCTPARCGALTLAKCRPLVLLQGWSSPVLAPAASACC